MPENVHQLQLLISDAFARQKAVVLYKIPGRQEVYFISGEVKNATELPETDGFVVLPFYNENNPGFFITQEITKTFSLAQPEKFTAHNNYNSFYKTTEKFTHFSTETEYCKLVENGLKLIHSGRLQKVVLSRAGKINFPGNFNLIDFYFRLANNYKNAFVYLLSTPLTGTWIGATPELLLEKTGNKIQTMALAGTIRNHTGKAVSFTEKEKSEQHLVTTYISEILKKYAEEISIKGPEIKQAGNISHLITNFKAFLKPAKNGRFTEIAAKLHPTPAVCGIPKEESLKFILENEGYNRSLYSGYLGPVTAKGDANLFVNLRCMNVFEKSAVLYAGAGIVKGSVPEKEWQETEHKMNTLLSLIEN